MGAAWREADGQVPHGRWKTMTFLAALRHDRIDAPRFIEGPIDGASFRVYVEKVLLPTLRPGDGRNHGQSRQPQRQGCASAHSLRRRQILLPAQILTRPERSNRSLPSSNIFLEKLPPELSRQYVQPSAKPSMPSHQMNAPTISSIQAIEPNLIMLLGESCARPSTKRA